MKRLTTIYFIVLVGLLCLTQKVLTKRCLQYKEPIYRFETEVIYCPDVNKTTLDKRQKSDDMVTIDFKCSIGDSTKCNKVKNVFITAGRFITATLNLKSPIKVSAQFIDFCAKYGECDIERVVLGAARPSRMIPRQDADNKVRLYPQALYKQLDLPDQHPEMDQQSEITALFNAKANYWFDGDPPITSGGQVDMLYVVLHELNHGLGFTSAWNDYFQLQALTPVIGDISDGQRSRTQFFEFIFDKFLILLPSGQALTSLTDQLNQFQVDPSLSDQNLAKAFSASPQFSIAKDMYSNATTHGKMGFLNNPKIPANTQLTPEQIQNDVVVLETSLNPLEPGSSIGHVDLRTYLNSSDFLMMFTYPPGVTLNEMMSRAGSTKTTGPIGPKLRTLLGNIGYDVKSNYSPPPNQNNSSLVRINLALSFVCILLSLIKLF